MKNVFPEKFVLMQATHKAYGQIKNLAANVCLDDLQQQNRQKEIEIGTYICHNQATRSQLFFLTKEGILRQEYGCLAVQNRSVFSIL